MSKKISSLAEPRFQVYFLCLVLFAGVTALLGDYLVAVAELAIVGVLYAVYCRQLRRQCWPRFRQRQHGQIDRTASFSPGH